MYIIIAVVVIVAIAACGICLVIGSRKKKEGFIIQGIITSDTVVGKITYKRRVLGRTTYKVVSKDIKYHEKIDLTQFPNISKIEGLAACFIVYEKKGQWYHEPIPGSGSQFVNISQIIKRLNIKTFFISDNETPTGSNKPILPPITPPTAPPALTFMGKYCVQGGSRNCVDVMDSTEFSTDDKIALIINPKYRVEFSNNTMQVNNGDQPIEFTNLPKDPKMNITFKFKENFMFKENPATSEVHPPVLTDEQIIADWKLCKSAPSEAQCTKALLGLKPVSKNQAIIDLIAYEVRPLQQTEKTINLFGGYTGFKTVIDAAHKIFAKEK